MNNHFGVTRGLNIPRTKFDISNSVSTTFNVGDLVPLESWEILPGDDFSIEISTITRLQTLLAPLMDDIHLDIYMFFVPNRLVWEHWREFMGENTKAKYYQTKDYFVPQVHGEFDSHTVGDYLGIPINKELSVSALPFRAYVQIWNDWFRDEALQDPILIDISDNSHSYELTNPVYGGRLLPACKYHDYFTSARPQPQSGEGVKMPLSGDIPVRARKKEYLIGSDDVPVTIGYVDHSALDGENHTLFFNRVGQMYADDFPPLSGGKQAYFNNLYADTSMASAASINDLRLAFATQQFLERDNLGGSRYVEIVRNHFGVISPDARLQRSELVGYFHDTLNVSQVVNHTDIESQKTALGDVGGLSVTFSKGQRFQKAFTEHGRLFALGVARYKHTYQQGIAREFSRKTKFDYYFPIFANLGEQPILNKEIYVSGTSKDEEVFGYQERWSEYRYKNNRVSAELRSAYSQPIDYWTLADNYESQPFLSSGWIREDSSVVNRALAVSDTVSNQIIMNCYFRTHAIRSLPLYSVPGLTRM